VTNVTEVRSGSAHLFAGMRRPLVSVITTLYYVAIIFYHRVWYCMLSLRYAWVWASSSSPRLPLCQILFLSRPPLLSLS